MPKRKPLRFHANLDADHARMLALRVPEDLHMELKILAIRRRMHVRDLILRLVRAELRTARATGVSFDLEKSPVSLAEP